MINLPEGFIDIIYLISVIAFVFGIKFLGSPKTARRGNLLSMIGMAIGATVSIFDESVSRYDLIAAGLVASAVIGIVMAKTVKMTGMPQMVALLNGFGGLSSYLVASAEYFSKESAITDDMIVYVSMLLSFLIGMVTFTGSLVAAGKLQEIITGRAVIFPLQKTLNLVMAIAAIVCGVLLYNELSGSGSDALLYFAIVSGLSAILGVTLVIPIGGADMPVVVSLLNSYSGIAVAMTGFVLGNNALIVVGSLVGASGMILTNIMCKAMNRSLANVLFGGFGAAPAAGTDTGAGQIQGTVKSMSAEESAMLMDVAETVIIVPGYGMAVSQAQHVVKKLTDYLMKKGTKVRFAIHPVAGRMPGHMNVLLAEAGVDYDLLADMDQINDDFINTDITIVIGANDVVNPAAKENPASPIYGMPVLNVEQSKTVLVLKRSMNPGFAGIDNELFYKDNTMMVFGDAKKTVEGFISGLQELE
ncbi:MAG: NAD(P)(+) transhydrogenase (Re/Si-specific) subunit beta [Leptospiraceae bacterium]|nr:NAD(P)(+) transhydrogenase (Re/Si-specific) subunit beta [Leptospiraceae bacterium]